MTVTELIEKHVEGLNHHCYDLAFKKFAIELLEAVKRRGNSPMPADPSISRADQIGRATIFAIDKALEELRK